ncbi:uncharacterized protein LOC122390208 [Amphibalanus amphitrite]|uniref:uncharacterized protein LOC122390208 n=1 Tax=Amphibalanus amphitrite TaxID=1232801 RepID=UPI001C9145E6|nr:uncharacterized protein LOC122390208 [Amphibalanus amphitrite]
MGGAKERDDIRWLIQLTLAFVYLHQGWTCGLGPRSDFDKTRAGNRAYHAYGQYNLNDDEWSAQDSTGINTDAWSHVTYADDAANNIVAGQWDRGTNSEPDHLWATPILYTHPDVYYSDYVFHMRNYFPYGTIGPNERKIATLRGKQPIWNAAVVKLFYFCAYDPSATDATPRDAELRIDLFYPGSGTRRTIWKVEDQQKILPPVRPAVESLFGIFVINS